MTAAESLSSTAMSVRSTKHVSTLPEDGLQAQRMFKKHKVLPHPRKSGSDTQYFEVRSTPRKYDLDVDAVASQMRGPQQQSPQTLRHQPKRIGSGPDLPPTPPSHSHSRTSSSSHSIQPPSPAPAEPHGLGPQPPTTPARPPATPPNQKSPPTPDVTPPQPATRPKAVRPITIDRKVSKATTAESRTESFRTAREEPFSSEEDLQSTVRPNILSARTSQNTVRRVSGPQVRTPPPVGLGLGLESPPEDLPTPKAKGDFGTFDGEWASNNEVEQEWDDNLGRNVTVRKRRPKPETPPRTGRRRVEIIEDRVVTPTNATKALRAMSQRDRAAFYAPSEIAWRNTSTPGTTVDADSRRLSGMSAKSAKSTKSAASTVVEAILVEAPSIPQRRQTLRHVRKQFGLRDSGSDPSPLSSATNSAIQLGGSPRRTRALARPSESRHDSFASNTTFNSISSSKARREVWKSGGIPVIVVPDRRSSRSSREPSLRSTSSRRSKRSASIGSAPRANGPKSHDLSTPVFERPGRRFRSMSESDGSDQRTIDYPPVIPKRSSSLSAPTSRNTSRAGSLTAESLKSQNALLNQQVGHETRVPALTLQRATSSETDNGHHHQDHKLNVDRHGDPFFGKRLSTQNTPFSAASVETSGTAPEVSEAKAVNLYPHQNSSVLVVNHSNKPSEDSEDSQTERDLPKTFQRPTIITTGPGGEFPITPPQHQHSMDDVDSPLRNPRAAPPVPPVIPPVIQFIPATPSGLTPNHERQRNMGNYFEAMVDEQPQRSRSVIKRALVRRRNSETYPPKSGRPGLLTRTFSLTRRGSSSGPRGEDHSSMEDPCSCPDCEAPPPEDDRLHPHWRPAYSDRQDDVWEREMEDEPISQVYRYPPIDNRPSPRRRISERMKKTFAILPVRGEDDIYSSGPQDEPERRTIRRTDSGNLRVMRRRSSLDSLRDQLPPSSGPSMRPDDDRAANDRAGPKRRRRFSISGTLEGLQNIPRQLNERKREKRTQELRQKISGPREVRDGMGDVLRRNSHRGPHEQNNTSVAHF
ncbi:hypothetical protein CORC01_13154 [Colletotrichum orchidophilum]|uniref:Uncharacterized protein n=1 Tax=Colletotrichum orchidophilum TaxID=1209926 RepID=A0A1G4AQV4_9PEZI|nr:uncharacterized protein CORC01_13154 [Colletotrichum orchidophilum]OHE91557.1 hypothetical protein CORC01_13154 [Colletotrichum orchidophilum]